MPTEYWANREHCGFEANSSTLCPRPRLLRQIRRRNFPAESNCLKVLRRVLERQAPVFIEDRITCSHGINLLAASDRATDDPDLG